MLDALEIRLADLLADALVGAAHLGPVGRMGAVAAPSAGQVGIAVRLAGIEPRAHVGDDLRTELRAPGSIRLRPTLHLDGQARIRLTAAAPTGQQSSAGRSRLITMLDRVLLALHPETVRTGRAFTTDADQGFDLCSFRLASVGDVPDAAGPLGMELTYAFSGLFWPVAVAPEGELITALPTRLVAMPVALPDRLVTRAGDAALTVPLRIDLAATGGAAAALAARLEGAAPPGALLGDGTPAPAGFTGFAVGADGLAQLVYQPPAAMAGRAEVRVEARLAHPDRPSIALTRFLIEVLAP